MSEPDELPAGTMFGRHSVVRLVASGGMAEVYEAEHLDLQKRVAVKVMRRALAGDPSLVQRFVLEARAASRLRHPNVIAIQDVGLERGRPYMIMEYLEGRDLCDTIHGGGPLVLERIADLMLPVISAVAAAHAEGILHRDLKPENIFLAQAKGSRERPVLLDFGISRLHDPKTEAAGRQLTRVGHTVGTPDYMSLEQLRGTTNLDERCDQYALGVILYECATQRVPYRADDLEVLVAAVASGKAKPPSALRSDLPKEFDELVMRAMSVDRTARFEETRALGRALWPFASTITQAIWAEEFGEPGAVLERLSSPPFEARPAAFAPTQPVVPTPAPTRQSLPAASVVTVAPADLRTFPAFDACSDADLQTLLWQASGHRFADGARILMQGAHGSGCFLLVSGEVQIVKSTSVGHWIVGALRAGSVFGQIALVDNLPRTASVIAIGEVVVLHIARTAFDKLLVSTSEVALRLREQIAISGIRQLRHATRRLTAILDRKNPVRTGTDPRRELVYVQVAAQEWELPLVEGEPS